MIYRRLECEISIVSSRSERKTIYYCFLIAEALDLNLKMTLTSPSPWSQRSRKQYLPEHTLVLSWGWKRNVRASKTFSTALILKEGAEQSPLCDKRKVFLFSSRAQVESSRVVGNLIKCSIHQTPRTSSFFYRGTSRRRQTHYGTR
jgi:hypothetical protein